MMGQLFSNPLLEYVFGEPGVTFKRRCPIAEVFKRLSRNFLRPVTPNSRLLQLHSTAVLQPWTCFFVIWPCDLPRRRTATDWEFCGFGRACSDILLSVPCWPPQHLGRLRWTLIYFSCAVLACESMSPAVCQHSHMKRAADCILVIHDQPVAHAFVTPAAWMCGKGLRM